MEFWSVAAAFFLLPAQAGAAAPRADPVGHAVAGWQAAVDAVGPCNGTAAEAIACMAEKDQIARSMTWLTRSPDLTAGQRSVAAGEIWSRIGALDTRHTERLKALIPADGWFRSSRDGERVAADAWTVAQHSPDHAFRERVLAAMAPLVKAGEVSGAHYALLYDRVAIRAGRPQRYGSQARCTGEPGAVMTMHPLEDPAKVDAFRAAIGYRESFALTRAKLAIGKPCDW